VDRTEALPARPRESATVRLLEYDWELGRGLGADDFEEALAACVARVLAVERGALRGWPLAAEPQLGFQGFLVLRGLLSRRVALGSRHAAELLGPGDLVRPWNAGADDFGAERARWRAHEAVKFAILDRAFSVRAARWPEVSAALLARAELRSSALVTQQLVAQSPGMAERIHLLLWQLADRWGRTCGDGVLLPLPLSRTLISELAGTTRESVSRALSRLAVCGKVESTERGFLLRDAPGTCDDSQRAATEDRHLELLSV
jgi:CRP/FNR family cyclic AMP-dependent transcriptional regulator